MSWVRIWIHLVFSTKNREPYLKTNEHKIGLLEHIKQNALQKDIWLDSIHGYRDHVHCLISFGKTQSVSQVAQLKKGESSNWINKTGMLPNHFSCPDDFWAVGVSESHVLLVRGYISNQEQHHKHRTFEEEINEFMKKYGWELIKE